MTSGELQRYLHRHIPLSAAMQVSVLSVSTESVVLRAPLEPNINHRDTVFGGSAAAVAVLAAWSLLHVRMTGAGMRGRLVIQRSTMTYDKPMTGAFTARSFVADASAWRRFLDTFERRGRARVSIAAVLEQGEDPAGRLDGAFVALRDRESGG